MELIDIADRMVTIRFDPEDCYKLALAARIGGPILRESHPLPGKKDNAPLSHWLDTAAVVFEAAALASGAYSVVQVKDADRICLKNMRDGHLLDPI